MTSPIVTLLLVGICCLSFVQVARSECCSSKEVVTYKMDRGDCEDVGGHGDYPLKCEVTICADGVAQLGTYCGQGSCNIFGCNCDGGCLTGEWSEDFVRKNQKYGIEIIAVKWIPW
ncbi:protein Diedel-like [Drosophila teissieri]|uniref:protein Diedel-like n=1 Tax=Drosophila teissieri TaxID=7243 RepID=UPI001CBA0733|nr:protein Diedel-like [Drosophila teissieri]